MLVTCVLVDLEYLSLIGFSVCSWVTAGRVWFACGWVGVFVLGPTNSSPAHSCPPAKVVCPDIYCRTSIVLVH